MSEQIPQEIPVEMASTQDNTAKRKHSWPAFLRRWALLIVIAGAVIGIDQTAKMLVIERLKLGQSWEPIPQIGNLIRVTRSYNTGAAFGMLPQAADIFLLLAIVTIAAFIITYPKLPSHAWLSRLSIALISGGALSNAIDRIRWDGHVIDYVHVQITPTLSNISNFADHAITVGVVLLLIDQWRTDRREKQQESAQNAEMADAEQADILIDNSTAQR